MFFVNIIIIILIVIYPIYLFRKSLKIGINILLNYKYWMLLYAYFYILVPSIYIETTSNIQNWKFSYETILYSKIISIYFCIIMLILVSFFSNENKVLLLEDYKLSGWSIQIANIVWYISILFASYTLYKIIGVYSSLNSLSRLVLATTLTGVEEQYNLKSLLFLNLTICTIKYLDKKKVISFLPLVLIALCDLLLGGRTYSFFAILTIYVNIAIFNRNLYLKQIAIVLTLLLVSMTIQRMSMQAISKDMSVMYNFFYQSLGEFIQTYNTIPYVIEYKLSSNNPLWSVLVNTIQGIFPGFIIEYLGFLELSPGRVVGNSISRGYGLGCNIITEWYFYGGIVYVILLPYFIYTVFESINKLLLKINFPGYIFYLYSIIYMRLMFREGFFTYIFVVFYIFIMYGVISVINYKRKIWSVIK